MPRYFVTTIDHVAVTDEEGVLVPDLSALRALLRRTLTEILRDEGERTGVDDFTAEARDVHGQLVMTARVSFYIADQ